MASFSTWTRAVRWLAVALLVAVLSLGPSVDALVCGNDGSLSAAAAEAPTVAGQSFAAPEDQHQGSDIADVCIHGHCHHYAPFVPLNGDGDFLAKGIRSQHDLERGDIRTSDPHFGLKRPPRG